MTTAAVELKLWLEGFVHVTDHDTLTGVAVDCAKDVSWTVTGFVLVVVQSPGSVSVNVVSTLTGVTGPLLWIVALPLTVKAVPAFTDAGEVAPDAATFTSVVALIAVVVLLLASELLPVAESTTCS
jgi:hypothetical protein